MRLANNESGEKSALLGVARWRRWIILWPPLLILLSSVRAKERANVLCNTYLFVLVRFVILMG